MNKLLDYSGIKLEDMLRLDSRFGEFFTAIKKLQGKDWRCTIDRDIIALILSNCSFAVALAYYRRGGKIQRPDWGSYWQRGEPTGNMLNLTQEDIEAKDWEVFIYFELDSELP